MNAHLSKPLDAKKMIRTIEKFCGAGVESYKA